MSRDREILLIAVSVVVVVAIGIYLWQAGVFGSREEVPRIVMSNCSNIEPDSIQVSEEGKFVIENDDVVAHTLSFAGALFEIPARDSLTITALFPNGSGAYGYECDNSETFAGQVQVVAGNSQGEPEQEFSGFAQLHESLAEAAQECVREGLGEEFEGVYDGFSPITEDIIGMVNGCLAETLEG